MNKTELTEAFNDWLNINTNDEIMSSIDFAEYRLNTMLESETDGNIIFENDEIIVGEYYYDYELISKCSYDGNVHHFLFKAVGIGSKENVTADDYDLADYTENTYILTI